VAESEIATPRWGNQGRDRKAQAILRTLIASCGDDITRGSWIDIGCGSGGIAAALAPSARQIAGFDPEPWPNWASMAAQHSNLSFTAAGFDNEQLPLPENAVDVVICNQVYEHVARPEQLIRNIHRVLKPGGVCYFAGPNLLWPIEPHVFWPVVHWLPRQQAQLLMRLFGSGQAEHLDAYSKAHWTLARWFKRAGFQVFNLLRVRVVAEFESSDRRFVRCIAWVVPDMVYKLLTPFSPGFVYLLVKPVRHQGNWH
jgi:2-polyprenyl-3-methyl-5-hydroxy-6-metoxy-1,4-benzoquinol methylase